MHALFSWTELFSGAFLRSALEQEQKTFPSASIRFFRFELGRYLSVISICLFLSFCLSIYLSRRLPVCLCVSTSRSICLSLSRLTSLWVRSFLLFETRAGPRGVVGDPTGGREKTSLDAGRPHSLESGKGNGERAARTQESAPNPRKRNKLLQKGRVRFSNQHPTQKDFFFLFFFCHVALLCPPPLLSSRGSLKCGYSWS